MVTLAAAMAQIAIGVLSFCVRDLFKCFAATTTPQLPDDVEKVDGMEDVHLNVTMTCCGARAMVENEAIVWRKSHTSLSPETLV